LPKSREPVRTCIGCRETFEQQDLMRFVRSPQGEILPDLMHKMPGRGAYVCYRAECLENATEKQQFQRSFKQPVSSLGIKSLRELIIKQLAQQLKGYLSLLRKAGQLKVGGNLIEDTLKKDTFVMVLMATDIAAKRSTRLERQAQACRVVYGYFATMEELGHWVGKGETSAIGIMSGGLADRFKKTFERYCQLSGEL